ncbi:hypothetical protein [Candidatus Nitrospira bockiana]
MSPRHIRLQPKAHDLPLVRLFETRFLQRLFELSLDRADIVNGEIDLNPAGRPGRPHVLPNNNEQTAIPIASNMVDLRVVDPYYLLGVEHLREEAFILRHIGRLDPNSFKIVPMRFQSKAESRTTIRHVEQKNRLLVHRH